MMQAAQHRADAHGCVCNQIVPRSVIGTAYRACWRIGDARTERNGRTRRVVAGRPFLQERPQPEALDRLIQAHGQRCGPGREANRDGPPRHRSPRVVATASSRRSATCTSPEPNRCAMKRNGLLASAGDRCDPRALLRLAQLLEGVLGLQRGTPRFMPLAREDLDQKASSTAKTTSCSCSGTKRCTGPRGGRYCITSGGKKRYTR